MHQSNGKYKADRPSWRWQGHGVFEFTHDADAARYVAMCRQRELDKMTAKLARLALVPPVQRSAAEMLRPAVERIGSVAA